MNLLRLVLILNCTLGVFMSTDAAAREYKIKWSGWGMSSQEADLNGDMSGGVNAQFSGRGSFGNTANHAVLDSVFAGFCDTGQGPSTGLLFNYSTHTNVLRSASGDLLYRTVSSSPPSTGCVDTANGTVRVKAYLDIVGGTGRFKGATGSSVLTTKVELLPGQNGIAGREIGKIYGVRKNPGQGDHAGFDSGDR